MYIHFLLVFIPKCIWGVEYIFFLCTPLNQQLSLIIENCIFLVKEYQKSYDNAFVLEVKKKLHFN